MQAIPHKTRAINSLPKSFKQRVLAKLRARPVELLDLPVVIYYSTYRITAWATDLPVEISPCWT